MASNYPGALDVLTNPVSTNRLTSPSHADQHANANDAIEAIQATLGVNPQGDESTVSARIAALEGGGGDARDGVTVLGSNTIEASFAASSKRVATRAADDDVTIDGTGYAAQIDVDIQITNTTGSTIAVSVLGAWALIGDAVTEIPAGETLHVVALSRGNVEGDVSYAMGLAVSP